MSGFPSGSDDYRRESERHWDDRERFERRLRFGDSPLSASHIEREDTAPPAPLPPSPPPAST